MHVIDPTSGLRRIDTQRNRMLLVNAAGRLFADGTAATMADVAAAAGTSTATAYRHFASVDEVLAAYRFEVGLELLDFSVMQDARGLELLRLVCGRWVQLVVMHGGSMIHTRSAEGYLARVVFFDPREIFDLIHSVGLAPERASERLVRTFTAALKGWPPAEDLS